MRDTILELQRTIAMTIVGQKELVERLLVALLSDGHVLIEGLPGLAKTTAVRCLANGLTARFQRIQFTPDLIPGDITGTDVYNATDGQFKYVSGPIFSEILLADEINRAPPKVQSALLEAMQEKRVTIGGVTRSLPDLFVVIATQNPIEHEGTYPLPEAQLDRFLFKLHVDYPTADEELEILAREQARLQHTETAATRTLTPGEVLALRKEVNSIYLDKMLERYIVALVGATRDPSPWRKELTNYLTRGASPRATLALARSARALAFLRGRQFVEPGDIMSLAEPVLTHRLGLSFAARADGISAQQVIQQLVASVPVP